MLSRIYILSFFFLFTTNILNADIKYPKEYCSLYHVEYIRETFYKSVEDKSTNDKFVTFLTDLNNQNPNNFFVLAYLGAAETLIAKHSYNPYTKLKYLNRGLEKIDKAIIKYPNSIELRFLRFSILHYIPSFLGFSNERNSDLNSLYELIVNKEFHEFKLNFYANIINFIVDSDRLDIKKNSKLLAISASIK